MINKILKVVLGLGAVVVLFYVCVFVTAWF